jgi:toxin ParE1/3/4
MPESGGMVPEYEDMNLREVLVGNYRVVYSLDASVVRIAAIIHEARQIRKVIDTRIGD